MLWLLGLTLWGTGVACQAGFALEEESGFCCAVDGGRVLCLVML